MSRPPANHRSACLNGTALGWVGDEGLCGGGEVGRFVVTLVVALPTLEGTPLFAAFLITSGVFQAFILAFSVWETISSMSGNSGENWHVFGSKLSTESSSYMASITGTSSSISFLNKERINNSNNKTVWLDRQKLINHFLTPPETYDIINMLHDPVVQSYSPRQVKLWHFTAKLIVSFPCSYTPMNVVSSNSSSQSCEPTLRGQADEAGPYLGFFVLAGKLRTPIHRGLVYTARVSSWTFLFSPLHRKLVPLRPLKKSKHTDAFCLKFWWFIMA